jgi:hypothetical protein
MSTQNSEPTLISNQSQMKTENKAFKTNNKSRKFDQKSYDRQYYDRNKEQLSHRKLASYYQHRYGILESEIDEFKRNKKIYVSLQQCDPVIVYKMLKSNNT